MSIGTLTLDEAKAELAKLDLNTITKADLEAIVQQVSVQDPDAGPNATTYTYLYSGPVLEADPSIAGDKGLSSNQLANAITNELGEYARITPPTAELLTVYITSFRAHDFRH